jgi:hypothetical protein
MNVRGTAVRTPALPILELEIMGSATLVVVVVVIGNSLVVIVVVIGVNMLVVVVVVIATEGQSTQPLFTIEWSADQRILPTGTTSCGPWTP